MELGKLFADFKRVLTEATPLLMRGMAVTVQVTIISLTIAFFLGLAACLMHRSGIKILSWISKIYVWAIRGTPLLVQAFFIYFGFPQLIQFLGFNFRLTPFAAAIISLSLNAGAYISEILRGGILAINVGQTEAARSLGLTKGKTMLKVVLPQALRISIPSLVNQMIITLKDTSIVSVISLGEIVYRANMYIGKTMLSFATWTLVGGFYLVLVTLLSMLAGYAERRFDYAKKG